MFDIPDYKKIRVIVDTDAACEADMRRKTTFRKSIMQHFRVNKRGYFSI